MPYRMSSFYISLGHRVTSTTNRIAPLRRRYFDLSWPLSYVIRYRYLHLARILFLFLCPLHLPLVIIEGHAHQEDRQDAYEAADQSEVPKELIEKARVAEVLVLVQGIPQEVVAVCQLIQF